MPRALKPKAFTIKGLSPNGFIAERWEFAEIQALRFLARLPCNPLWIIDLE
jgi:hypothetical protein